MRPAQAKAPSKRNYTSSCTRYLWQIAPIPSSEHGKLVCFIYMHTNARVSRRGTVYDKMFPFAKEDYKKMTKADLIELIEDLTSREKVPSGRAKGTKRWQPDGSIGFTRAAVSKLPNYRRLLLSEQVYLGIISIEHKPVSTDFSDLYVFNLAYVLA